MDNEQLFITVQKACENFLQQHPDAKFVYSENGRTYEIPGLLSQSIKDFTEVLLTDVNSTNLHSKCIVSGVPIDAFLKLFT